jgi:hypothetical protein
MVAVRSLEVKITVNLRTVAQEVNVTVNLIYIYEKRLNMRYSLVCHFYYERNSITYSQLQKKRHPIKNGYL